MNSNLILIVSFFFYFQEQAAAILKTAMGKIDLKVGRLKAGAASPRSATSAES